MSEELGSEAVPFRPVRLLRTKLFIPRTHPDVIARPRLINLLNDSLARKVAIISAPAGSGKSTLLSSWVDSIRTASGQGANSTWQFLPSSQVPGFAWVSLDERDNEPGRFWTYFIAALQTLQPEIGATALSMLQSLQPLPFENLLTEVLNDMMALPGQVALVLDDYHQINDQSIQDGIAFLIENLPTHIHLVLAGRTSPPLALPQYRVRRELVELDAEDLRFTLDEATEFLRQVMHFDLSAENIAALDRLTEGWIAGLQLAALSMQDIGDFQAFLRSFTGSHRYVFDYLAQEVLERQSAPVRKFLMQTSVLDRLQGDLCDAITGPLSQEGGDSSRSDPGFLRGQEILLYLEKSNLFLVPLDPQRLWYRYHHLFSDFLRIRLEQVVGQAGIADLHRKASQWFEGQGLLPEAVDHAFQAEDFQRAAHLIRDSAQEMFQNSELNLFKGWVKALPPALVRADPGMSMALSWALVATSETDIVDGYLQDIEHFFGVRADGSNESLEQPDQVLGALAEISCIRASLAFNRLDIDAVLNLSQQACRYLEASSVDGLYNDRAALMSVTTFDQAVAHEFRGEVLPAIDLFNQIIHSEPPDLHLFPMALGHLAQLQILLGQLRQAEKTYQQAMDWIQTSKRPSPLSAMILTGLGNIQCERNQLELANRSLQQGIEMGRPWNQWESLLTGYFGLARVRSAQGDFTGAQAALQELAATADRLKYGMALPAIQSQQTLLAARMGDIGSANRWIESSQLPLEGPVPFWLESEVIVLARVLLCVGRCPEAVQQASRVFMAAEASQCQGRVIETLALRSVARFLGGEIPAAQEDLLRALLLAQPEGYVRLFLDEGKPLQKLLLSLNADGPLQDYIHLLLSASQPDAVLPQKAPAKARAKAKTELPPLAREAGIEPLSERELDVLRLMAGGLTNQEIADSLVISLNTVKTHVKNILAHLEASNRTEAIAHARQLGLI